MILAQDPLYTGDWLGDLGVTLLKVGIAFALLLVAVMLNIWFLRKVISDFQNCAAPTPPARGILQSLADGIKLFFEDLLPDNADRPPSAAPYCRSPSVSRVRHHPHRWRLQRWGRRRRRHHLRSRHLPPSGGPAGGVLWFLAMSSLAIYGSCSPVGACSKYPLIGSVRASAQMCPTRRPSGLPSLRCSSCPAPCRPTPWFSTSRGPGDLPGIENVVELVPDRRGHPVPDLHHRWHRQRTIRCSTSSRPSKSSVASTPSIPQSGSPSSSSPSS